MNPSNDALVQQMLQQNQMLMQMVLAQQPGALQQVQPVVLPQPPLAVPQPAAQPELRQVEPEEREEILPQDVRPFKPIKYDQTDACRGNAISADDRPLRDQPSSLKAERRILVSDQ